MGCELVLSELGATGGVLAHIPDGAVSSWLFGAELEQDNVLDVVVAGEGPIVLRWLGAAPVARGKRNARTASRMAVFRA